MCVSLLNYFYIWRFCQWRMKRTTEWTGPIGSIRVARATPTECVRVSTTGRRCSETSHKAERPLRRSSPRHEHATRVGAVSHSITVRPANGHSADALRPTQPTVSYRTLRPSAFKQRTAAAAAAGTGALMRKCASWRHYSQFRISRAVRPLTRDLIIGPMLTTVTSCGRSWH